MKPLFTGAGRLLAEMAAIFVLYFATAKIGFLAAIPPGNVTIIWPPSGIAVAAFLILGYRAAAGVWLSSFAVNLLFMQGETAMMTAAAVSASIAFGSTCQDALIAILVRRRYGTSDLTMNYSKILACTMIAMLCCLIAATAGAGSLFISGMINIETFARTWGAWWLGDFLGILVVTPLTLFVVRFIQKKHEPSYTAALVLSTGLGLSLLLFITMWNLETQKISTQFDGESRASIEAMKDIIDLSERSLSGITGLFSAASEVTRREFHVFTQTQSDHKKIKGIQALEWIPRVSHDRRDAYEKTAQQEGFQDFRITERDAAGKLVRAAERPEYYPVYFVEPLAGNEAAVGFDLASNKARKQALEQARDSASYVVTEPITLVQETGEQKGFLILKPVYRDGALPVAVAERRNSLVGFALAVCRIGDLVEASIAHINPGGLNIYLFDKPLDGAEQLLYAHSSRTLKQPMQVSEKLTTKDVQNSIYYSGAFTLGDRPWTVVIRPAADYVSSKRSWIPWGSLGTGLAFTLLLFVYVLNRIHAQKILEEKQIQLRERIKEQRCLYSIFELTEDMASPLDEQLRKMAEVIPPGWFYPEITSVRIEYDGMVIATPGFAETTWMQTAEAPTQEGKIFRLTVAYREEKPPEYEGPFLKEERTLINAIVHRLAEKADRRHAEETLRESEGRYRRLFENAHDALSVMEGPSWKFASVNPACVRMFGALDEAALLAYAPWQLSPERQPDGRSSEAKALEMIAQALQNGFHFFEWTHRRITGEEFFADVLLVCVEQEGHEMLQATVRDVTERKQADATIREHELQLRTLGDNLPGGILYQILVTPDSQIRYTYISAGVERVLGVTPEQVKADAKAFWGMIVEADRERVMSEQALALEQMTTFDCEFRQRTATGKVCWLRVRAQPRRLPDGFLLWDGVAMDITERKEAEQAAYEEAALNRATIASVPGTFYMLDAAGRYVRWNDYQRDEIVGKPETEMAGFPAIETIHPEDRALIQERIVNVLQHGREEVVEGRVLLRGGPAYRWLLMTGRRMMIDGQPHLVGFGIDLTERRKAEEALRQSEERYRVLVETTGTGFLILDQLGRVLDANAEYVRLAGREQLSEILGRSVTEWTVPSQREYNAEAVARCLRDGGIRDLEVGYLWPGGRVVPVEINATVQIEGESVRIISLCRDITERKRAEESLRESEARFRGYFELGQVGMAITSLEKGWVRFNDRLCDILGYPREELSQLTWAELTYPDDLPEDVAQFDRVLRGEIDAYRMEKRFIRKDGEIIHALISARCVRRADGRQVDHFVAMVDDITERKHAEQELSEKNLQLEEAVLELERARSMLQLIIESIPVRVFWKDRELRYLGCNSLFARDGGFQHPEELLGKDDLAMGWREQAELYQADDRQVMGSGLPRINIIEPQTTPDGSTIWLSTSKVPLYSHDGEIIGVLGLYEDITDRKRAQEAERAASRYARSLIEASLDPLVTISPDGKITDVNAATEIVTGYDRKHLIGTDLFNYFTEPEQARAGYKAVFEKGSLRDYPLEVKHRNGRLTSVLCNASVYRDEKGRIEGVFAAARDITERKILESQLHHAQKLEAIGTLAGGIAHDFNNILSPIIGYTEMAMDGLDDSSSSMYELDQVLTAANRAKDLVRQILSFSRLREDQLMRPIDMSLIVKEALTLLRASLPSTIEIRQNLNSVTVVADATQIHQVVVNLCTNAAHAMEDMGVLDVSLLEVHLGAQDLIELSIAGLKPGKYLKLSVKDTGMGMDPDIIQRIFDPYFTTKEVGKGTGLGLAVVHGIVKRHGGEILVKSEVGRGTVFDVFIPAVDSSLKREASGSETLPKGSERILLVDDEPAIAAMGARILEQLGYKVTAKTNPSEALDLFRSQSDQFDLIITDYTMPQMVGTKLADECRQIRAELPVIICTGYSEKLTKEEPERVGANAVAMKPLDRKQLAMLVREVLDKAAS
jgi:PAS domain S-box-containing protein